MAHYTTELPLAILPIRPFNSRYASPQRFPRPSNRGHKLTVKAHPN